MNDTIKTLNHIVDLHKEMSHVHTYIDAYLEQIEEKDGQAKSDAHDALIASLDNILLGGDGIFFGFFSLLYCLAKFPDVQVGFQLELRCYRNHFWFI